MSVKRYSVWEDEMFEEKHALNSTNGMVHLMVKHEDYAALEARCAALAAENAGLKAAIETHKHGFVRCNCCGDELMCHTDDVCRALDETPATDAFLAEVRAQGVDALVERRLTAARLAKEAGRETTARDLEGEAIRARFFAMEIRNGVQS